MVKAWSNDLLIYGKHVNKVSKQLEDKAKKFKLNIYKGFNYFYIGRRWDNIRTLETPEEFETKINIKMNKIFGSDIKCETYFQDAFYY